MQCSQADICVQGKVHAYLHVYEQRRTGLTHHWDFISRECCRTDLEGVDVRHSAILSKHFWDRDEASLMPLCTHDVHHLLLYAVVVVHKAYATHLHNTVVSNET